MMAFSGFIPHLLDLKNLGVGPWVGTLKAFQVIPRHPSLEHYSKGRVGVSLQKTKWRGGKVRKKEGRRCFRKRIWIRKSSPRLIFALYPFRQQKSQLYSEKEKQVFFMQSFSSSAWSLNAFGFANLAKSSQEKNS